MSKIITLMPTRGLIFTKVESALEQELLANNQLPFILRTDNLPIPDCRTKLVGMSLEVPDWTHALMVDDDVILPEGGLRDMLDLDTDIAVIDYPMHHSDGPWTKMGTIAYDNWKPGQPFLDKEIGWSGLGCALVKREVLEKMERPWFKVSSHYYDRDENGHITIKEEQHPETAGGGEDTYFILKAKNMGYKIKQARGVAGHARLVRSVLALQNDKYYTQHKISVNHEIEEPYR